jgi:general stress protein YciG
MSQSFWDDTDQTGVEMNSNKSVVGKAKENEVDVSGADRFLVTDLDAIDFQPTPLAVDESDEEGSHPKTFARFNENQPRGKDGRWIAAGDVAAAAGSVEDAAKLFGRLKEGDTEQAEKLVAFLQEKGMAEADAKQAMKQGTGKQSTGAAKPDPQRVQEAGSNGGGASAQPEKPKLELPPFDPDRPRTKDGRWIDPLEARRALYVGQDAVEMFKRIEGGNTEEAEKLVSLLQKEGMAEDAARKYMKQGFRTRPDKPAESDGSGQQDLPYNAEAVDFQPEPGDFKGSGAWLARRKIVEALGPVNDDIYELTLESLAGDAGKLADRFGIQPGADVDDENVKALAQQVGASPKHLVAIINMHHDPAFQPERPERPLANKGKEYRDELTAKLGVGRDAYGEAIRASNHFNVSQDIAPEDPTLNAFWGGNQNVTPVELVKVIAHEAGPTPKTPNIAPPETVYRDYKEGETRRIIDKPPAELDAAADSVPATPELKAYASGFGSVASQLNKAAREGKLDSLPPAKRQVFDGVNELIRRNATTFEEPVNLYRGVAVPEKQAEAFIENMLAAAESGEPIAMKGIVSSSLSPNVATKFAKLAKPAAGKTQPMVFEIKSHSGLYVAKRSNTPKDMEVLQEHGTQYRVAGVERKVNVGGFVTTLVKLEQL